MHSRIKFCIALVLFAFLILFVSCNDRTSINVSEVIVVEPIVSESNEKALISPTLSIDEYKIKMVPAWVDDSQSTYQVYGSTEGKGINGSDYVVFDPLRMGYYSQGVWWFGLEAYSEGKLVYKVNDKKIEINGISCSINISPEEIVPVNPNGTSSVSIANFDFLLVDSEANYGNTYYLKTEVVPLNSGSNDVISESVIDKASITFNGSVGVVDSWTIASGLSNGAYSVNISLYENIDGSTTPKRTGTVSCVMTSVPGVDVVISGKSKVIDLYPSYYSTPGGGTGGVIIDSGINSVITITSKAEGNAVENNTVTNGTTVTFTASVTQNGVPISDISNNIWMVNGDIQSGFDTNVFSYQFTENKTYTITYMFTDSTSYNTISKNEYIKVTAASSS